MNKLSNSGSIFLKRFLKNIGQSVLFINTVVVSLSHLSKVDIDKDDSLSIYWSPPKDSEEMQNLLKSSRRYVLSSALVLVQNSLMDYIKSFYKVLSLVPENEASEKIKGIFSYVEKEIDIPKYWCPMLILLVYWRNKIVHGSSSKYPSDYERLLNEFCVEIKKEHASIDIERTLEHFEKNKITLKDFSTFISIAIRAVKSFDSFLCDKCIKENNFINFIKADIAYVEKIKVLNKILSTQSDDKKVKEFSMFMLKNYGVSNELSSKIDLEILYLSVKEEIYKIKAWE